MSRDQTWDTPWGWDDAEGDGEVRARAVDHVHHCARCGKTMACYGPGCGIPPTFDCAACAVRSLPVVPADEPEEADDDGD